MSIEEQDTEYEKLLQVTQTMTGLETHEAVKLIRSAVLDRVLASTAQSREARLREQVEATLGDGWMYRHSIEQG